MANPYSYSINLLKGSPVAALQLAINKDVEGIIFLDSSDLFISNLYDAAVFHIVKDEQIGDIAPNQKKTFLSLNDGFEYIFAKYNKDLRLAKNINHHTDTELAEPISQTAFQRSPEANPNIFKRS